MKKLSKKQINKLKLKEWADAVKARAGYKCEICNRKSPLDAHHLLSRQLLSVRYDVCAGICLCKKCHKFDYYCSPHKAPIGFAEWLRINKPELYKYILGYCTNVELRYVQRVAGSPRVCKD